MEINGNDSQPAEGDMEYDEALKLALKLSLEEFRGPSNPINRYHSQASGFFSAIRSGDENRNVEGKNRNDTVSMEFILDKMQQLHKTIKKGVEQLDSNGSTNMQNSSSAGKDHRISMSRNQLTDLIETLFGNEEKRIVSYDDVKSWCKQGFRFQDDPNLFWGLKQIYGGPCGVLASIQAYMLHCVLFHNAMYGSLERLMEDETVDAVLMKLRTIYINFIRLNHPDFPEEWLHIPSLLEALCAVLYNATPASKYTIILFEPFTRQGAGNIIHTIIYNSNYIIKEFNSVADVATHLLQNIHLLMCEMGVISFTLSLIATRGVENVQNDMDDAMQPLVGMYGHSTQELVNLMLQGKAVSNVFDGEKVIQDNDRSDTLKLKGITKEAQIGFLTELEARRYCKVGSYYKNPKLPIWVISSHSHYTVLFGIDNACCRRTCREIYEETLLNIWACLDPDDNKFITKQLLPTLLEMLAIPTMYNEACSTVLENSDIILQSDFIDWYLARTTMDAGDKQPEAISLFQYNGQDTKNPLTMITVKNMEKAELEKSRILEDQGDMAGVDASIVGHAEGAAVNLAKIVWTRWPKTRIEICSTAAITCTRERSESMAP
ncbi:hypothetical protein X943_001710 [Babesia divergens]|uniref:Deubiquitinating enzyme MINDY-3/4 conserved domain-containing protein n=1 Tax=Babesia divergens TaxID=32595 RepID=A0AAD9G6Y8_BABDI|nr:hypothetical protein X943_001710 [Babesia divergens]